MNGWDIPTPDLIERWKEQGEIRKLIHLLAAPEGPHHLLALRALEDIGDEAVPSLVQVLEIDTENIDLLCSIVDLLSLLRARAAVRPLEILIERGSEWFDRLKRGTVLWVSCVDALGRIATSEGLATLHGIASNPGYDTSHRRRAVEALALSRSKLAIRQLTDLWASFRDIELKRSAMAGLVAQGQQAVEVVSGLSSEERSTALRLLIIETIGDLQAEAFLPLLIEWMKEAEGEVLNRILWAMGEIGDTRVNVPIREKMMSLPQELRFIASQVLVKLGWSPGSDESEESRIHHNKTGK